MPRAVSQETRKCRAGERCPDGSKIPEKMREDGLETPRRDQRGVSTLLHQERHRHTHTASAGGLPASRLLNDGPEGRKNTAVDEEM